MTLYVVTMTHKDGYGEIDLDCRATSEQEARETAAQDMPEFNVVSVREDGS